MVPSETGGRRMLQTVSNMSDLVKAIPQGCDNGALTDQFGVLIQAVLAAVAFSGLLLKRWREPKEERRPWRIWCFDTSKQAIGALFIHFTNVFLSQLTEEDPCSLYLMHFLLDATLGMLMFEGGKGSPPNCYKGGISQVLNFLNSVFLSHLGDPPQAAAWLGQCVVYLLIMIIEKTIISLVLLIKVWIKLQEILLDYITNPKLELVLVMLVVPFIVNAIMFWLVDSLIMRKYKRIEVDDPLENKLTPESPPVRDDETQVLLGPSPVRMYC